MDEELKLTSYSEGDYTLRETEHINQYVFFRSDGECLTNIDKEPIDLYHSFMVKVAGAPIEEDNYGYEMALDNKAIRLTIYPYMEVLDKPKSLVKEK